MKRDYFFMDGYLYYVVTMSVETYYGPENTFNVFRGYEHIANATEAMSLKTFIRYWVDDHSINGG